MHSLKSDKMAAKLSLFMPHPQMAVLTVWIFFFPDLTDGILDMVGIESFFILMLGGNEGFK